MIIRKPYAFLIKNFKKIHVFLLLLSFFVAYRLIDISGFVNEFMNYGIYDLFQDPITNHINIWLYLSLFLLVIGSLALLFLLLHKKKPWKIYLIPVITYATLFFVLGMIKSFFNHYSIDVETTDLRLSRDLLLIFLIVQVPAIGVFFMRFFGLDIKKFQFNVDQEFLELSEEDREEIEIGWDVDKHTFIRFFRKMRRHFGYFYEEHKKICRTIVGILILVLLFNVYQFVFVTHKSYTEGEVYSANGYTFKINASYFTDRDYHGEIITEKSNFVILDLTIQNNSAPRTIYLENFHLKNGSMDYVTTRKNYATEFSDLGKTYDSVQELKRNEVLNCIVIYKVDKRLKKNRFVLYYQEPEGLLRKIKLKLKDSSKIEDPKEYSLEDEFTIQLGRKEKNVSFIDYEIFSNAEYTVNTCTYLGCKFSSKTVTAGSEEKILQLKFASDDYEGKNMIEFLKNYGKIVYKDSEGEEGELQVTSAVEKNFYGKQVYLRVPAEIESFQYVKLDMIVRNYHYVYQLF